MARKHAAQWPSLANLVFLAGAASGTLLTLSNFQSLTSSVSVQCLYAYNLPIRGCSPRDFTGGATCSESCIAGLQAVQFTVRGLCANVNGASNSLLIQVKEGHILDALCKMDTPQMSTTSTPTPPPKETPPPPPPPSKPPKESSGPEPESTTSNAISTTSSAPSEAATSVIPTLTSVVIPSSVSESTTEATNAPTSQATNDEQASSTSEEKPKPTRKPNTQPGSGGGSPFDFVAISKATKFGLSEGSITMAIAIAFTTLTLI